ncbi:class I SAM-dependent methyltransferase [Nocardioides sp.]|uniref:class I SAM-dependent methyltransferase n=1 Tax=Nocardioides sp. TaxID=35761 RepID=UPI003D098481
MSNWSGQSYAYRASFATLCEGPVGRLLSDTAGALHLDVGSGTGSLAARAAALGRTVVAVDADPEMVSMTSTVVPGRVIEARLPDLPFDGSTFDAVTANFVINHVPDPRAAVRELARVTCPGGRVAITVWTAHRPAWATLVSEAFGAAGVVALPSSHLSADLDFERSVDGLRGLTEDAGLEAITATEVTWDWTISADALWRGIAGGVATAGQTFLAQTTEVRRSAEREFRERAKGLERDGLLGLPSTAAYVVAG